MAWTDLPTGGMHASAGSAGVDPNLVWADASAFVDFLRPGERCPAQVPVIVQLKASSSRDGLVRLQRELTELRAGWIPDAYPRIARAFEVRHCTAFFATWYCDAAINDPQRYGTMIECFELQMPVIPRRARPPRTAASAPEGARPARRADAGKLLIGVIDTGCPFANLALRDPSGEGTRVLHIWDQDPVPAFDGEVVQGKQPSDFGYGCEVSRDQLNALIRASTRASVVSEEGCYRAAGYDALNSRFAHGAAVLGLLAGTHTLGARTSVRSSEAPKWNAAGDEASRSDIVFVQLPRDSVQDSSSADLARLVLDGLRYIVSCAGSETRQIVVNISNGTSRGSHDGESILEGAMGDLVREQKGLGRDLQIVLPVGNAFDEERHAQFDALAKGLSEPIAMRVPPGGETPTYVLVRIPKEQDQVGIRVLPPDADSSDATTVWPGRAVVWPSVQEPRAAVVYPMPSGTRATLALVVIAPTTASARAQVVAPHGVWSIQLEARQDVSAPVHMYITRNQQNPGALPRAKQAIFLDTDETYDPARYLAPAEADPAMPKSRIRRGGTLNGLTTLRSGAGVWAVGAYILREGPRGGAAAPSLYSACGPAAGGGSPRPGPDVSAPADFSRALRGILASGVRSGEVVRVTGTSFAAPQVARWLANYGKLPSSLPGQDPLRNGRGKLPLT